MNCVVPCFDAAAFIGLADIDPTVGLKIGVTYVFSAFSLP
jgi:hypothetical protein